MLYQVCREVFITTKDYILQSCSYYIYYLCRKIKKINVLTEEESVGITKLSELKIVDSILFYFLILFYSLDLELGVNITSYVTVCNSHSLVI